MGLRKAGPMNKSLLAKLAWRVVMHGEAFWCKVLWAKYGSGRGERLDFVERLRDSRIWNGVGR